MSLPTWLRTVSGRASRLAIATAACAPMAAGAQTEVGRTDITHEVFAGSELEGYLRTLQNVGAVGPYPWSVRAFSPAEVERMTRARTLGPWAARFEMEAVRSGPAFGWTTPRLAGVFNSAFPYGGNDGPLWAGRGLTTELQFGGFARWGPLSVVIHPVWFRAENADFLVAENGLTGEEVYRSALTPGSIDLPQRFGAGPYGRLDPGYSTVRLDFAGVTAGFSTAAQQWGASHLHPLVLGPAAGGFVHAFLGTDGPRNVGIGRAHARYVAGRTRQSDYFGSQGMDRFGFVTGLVVVLEPRGLTGLEVGAARFFKLHWDSEETRVDQLVRPFETFLKRKIDGADQRRDQQFASVFARWSFPDAGIELFGEYVRVDHSHDLRVLMLEPDDQAGYALGLRRVWEGGDGALTVLRGEVVTSGSTHRERGGARVAAAYTARPIYHEGSAPRLGGHTHHGQLLATVAGEFGNGQTLGLDRYTQDGRWSVELDRRVVRDRSLGLVPEDAADVDVLLALGGEVVRFRGRWELRAGAAGVLELNRHLRDDAFNFNFRLGSGIRVP